MSQYPKLPHPKEDARNKESRRLSALVRRYASLAGWCVIVPCGWVKWLFVRIASPAEVRAVDQARQSAVRRELRGLPATHDAARDHV
jgi:hypothetical protein